MIKKIFITLILSVNIVLASSGFSQDDLARIEFSRYGEAYENQSLSERLNRLETDIFGMSQSGSLNERLNMLAKMSENNINNRIVSSSENFYPGEKPSKIKNFWSNITEPFSMTSTMTGYTPSWNYSGYGYPNNMYRNEFLNFMNNTDRYCPYHNRYHNTNRLFNRLNNKNNGLLNSNTTRPYYHNHLHTQRPYYNRYQPYNQNRYGNYYNQYPSIPPNIAARSSVHIIKD